MLQPVLHAVTLPDVSIPRQHRGQIRTLATELISSHFLNPSHARVGPKDCWGLTNNQVKPQLPSTALADGWPGGAGAAHLWRAMQSPRPCSDGSFVPSFHVHALGHTSSPPLHQERSLGSPICTPKLHFVPCFSHTHVRCRGLAMQLGSTLGEGWGGGAQPCRRHLEAVTGWMTEPGNKGMPQNEREQSLGRARRGEAPGVRGGSELARNTTGLSLPTCA